MHVPRVLESLIVQSSSALLHWAINVVLVTSVMKIFVAPNQHQLLRPNITDIVLVSPKHFSSSAEKFFHRAWRD